MILIGKIASVAVLMTLPASGYDDVTFASPAGERPAIRRMGNPSILPGGRVVAPLGHQFVTGPGPYGLAVSPGGRVVSANVGPERLSVTYLEPDKKAAWLVHNLLAAKNDRDGGEADEKEWRGVFTGIAFSGEKSAWVSEGNSGRVRLIDLAAGDRRKVLNLNQNGATDSFSGDLAVDPEKGLLYVVDLANFRLVIFDVRKGRLVSAVKVGRIPFALALSPDRNTAYVTNVGVFEYQPIPGASKSTARESGLPFPAFGFPSEESKTGAKRMTGAGEVHVPGLGDPNVKEANSLTIVNVSDPAAPKVEAFIRTGQPFGPNSGGSSPSGVLATAKQVYVSNAHNDSITVIDTATRTITGEIPLRIPRLQAYRGVMPLGMAFDSAAGTLLAACAGINAIALIDTNGKKPISLLPTGWFPTRVIYQEGMVYVSNAKGQGTGPNLPGREMYQDSNGLIDLLRRGSISLFPMPGEEERAKHTGTVLSANGLIPVAKPPVPVPEAIKHVVLIVKENRTFDEVFGDVRSASNGGVAGAPPLARFGRAGFADGGRNRLSLQKVNVTPNHHEMAARWAFSDNFYADSEVSVDGHHWLVGNYPDSYTESSLMSAYADQKAFRFPTTAPGRLLQAGSDSSVHPEEIQEAGTIWDHFERHRISFRNFGEGFELAGVDEGAGLKPTGARFLTNVPMPDALYRNSSREYPGFNMNIPDQFRADQFIKEIDTQFAKTGAALPQFIYIHLPQDHITKPRPEDGYPYPASFVADNDYALGRIVEYLSHSPWWKEMAIFVTEDDAQGGRDHIDAHRTVMLGIGPHFKKNYVIHTNSSFPGLLKTVFRILKLPPLNLFDATAADLSEAFTTEPDFTPYEVKQIDPRLFVPADVREPKDPKPSPKMDARQ